MYKEYSLYSINFNFNKYTPLHAKNRINVIIAQIEQYISKIVYRCRHIEQFYVNFIQALQTICDNVHI